jgi:hypothetical protein
MSKGHGRVQRKILDLIAAEPNGAWSITDICHRVYGRADKAQRVAVGRALRHMPLPGTWTVYGRHGRHHWLMDECNMASVCAAHGDDSNKPGFGAKLTVTRAIRWRDASPVERIDIQIGDLRTRASMFRERGTEERIARLEAEKQRLVPPAEITDVSADLEALGL